MPFVGETRALFHTPHQEDDATIGVKRHRATWALASMECRQRVERQEDEAQGTMPSSKTIKDDLRDLTDAEQVTLVQHVLRGDEEAIVTFFRCTERLLIQITRPVWGEDDAGVCVDDQRVAYHVLDRVFHSLTYLVYGLRPTGYAESSPLQRWLDHPDQRIPLAKYVACVARQFLRDMRRTKRFERMTISERKLLQAHDDTDGHAIHYYDHIEDQTCPSVEEGAVYYACRRWWARRTPGEQALLRLLDMERKDLKQQDVAQRLGMSPATVSRRRRQLVDDLIVFLKAD